MTRTSSSIIAVAVALTLASCGRGPNGGADDAPTPIVSTASPIVAPAETFIELTGVVAPAASVDLVARVSGTLLSKGFDDGDQIRAGQTLFRLDPAPYAAEHAVNQARLTQAQADDRRQNVLAEGDATSQASQDAARSALGQAQASSRLSGLNLSYATIRAPFSGWIGASSADVGAYVAAGTKLGVLQKIDQVQVEFSIGEQDLARLRRQGALAPGVEVKVGGAGATDFPYTGRLDSFDPALAADTGSLPARAIVANPTNQRLLPGMFVRVRIQTGGGAPAMMVPQSVVQSDPLSEYVLVVGADNKVARRDVVTGDDVGVNRVILSGLQTDDRVIVSGLASVGPGASVAVRADTPSQSNSNMKEAAR